MINRLGSYLASRPKGAAVLVLALAVAFVLVLAGLALELSHSGLAPYPSEEIPLSLVLVDDKVIYTQHDTFGFQNESYVGPYPYTGMKILFRVTYAGTSSTMPVADFGNHSQLSTNISATVHQVLMTSSWVDASMNITDSAGDGTFGEGDTIAFDMVPLNADMVFTVGVLWTDGEGGGAMMEVSFVVHDGRLYAWYSQYLNDWYNSYLFG
jgi:hypothetical protein